MPYCMGTVSSLFKSSKKSDSKHDKPFPSALKHVPKADEGKLTKLPSESGQKVTSWVSLKQNMENSGSKSTKEETAAESTETSSMSSVKERMKAILEGDTAAKCPSNIRIVRIFTSSTFTDTKNERNALMTRVYPRLKEYCKSKGYEFQVVDMRWGVRDESTADHMTTALCMQEIKACQELSTGPNFVTFLGQKYGYRPFPAKIFATEFERLLEAVSDAEDRVLLKQWFYRDDNSLPPVYILQPITVHLPHFNDNENAEARKSASTEWWKQFEAMQVILRRAATKQLAKQDVAKYLMSVTEDEIQHGILKAGEPNKHCLWFRRHIKKLHEEASKTKDISRFYIDMLEERVDEQAVALLKQLKENGIEKTLAKERIVDYEVAWVPDKGIDPTSCPQHQKYIDALCVDFEQVLTENIQESIAERSRQEIKDPLFEEVVQHISTCQEKCSLFHGRGLQLAKIKAYLSNANRSPMVVHGESGCGKTSLVAMAARQADHSSTGVRPAVVVRFLGTTQQSSNVRAMLYSVCQQICRIYEDTTSVPEDYNRLTKYFTEVLSKATPKKPLAVFLDSLDQLSEDYGARQLAWLPLALPANVKLVVSTLPGEVYFCFPILKIAIEQENAFVEVPPLPNDEAIWILDKWLGDGGRGLTTRQNQVVRDTFARCSLALFVKLTFDEVCRWKSYTPDEECVLQTTVHKAINSVFTRLEYRHGKLLVSHALSYLTQSRHGVSDPEMEDLLSLDDEVLNDVYQYWTPPSRRLPPLLWIRIKTELGSYVVARGADGVRVNTWYHRQFVETARERYLSCEEHVKKISKLIGEYFLGTWAADEKPYKDKNGNCFKADRLVAKQPLIYNSNHSCDDEAVYNLRKFSELPHSLIGAGMLACLKEHVLCDYQWLYTKLLATSFRDVIADFNQAGEAFPDDDELILVRETLQLSTTALDEDPSQLASQLVGRLLNKLREAGSDDMVHAKRLVYEQAHRPPQPALVPDKVCLTEPGGPILHTITAHTSFSNVYLTKDKKRIFSASYDGTLKIFDARHGFMIRSTEGVKNMTKHFEVDSSEEIGVTSCDRVIQVWKINTGQLLHVFSSSRNVSPVALINDHIIAIAEQRLEVLNFRTGIKERTFQDTELKLEAHWHKCCITCPSTGELVAYSRDKENIVNIWNYKTSEVVHVVTVEELQSVDAMTVSTAGQVYATSYKRGPVVSFDLYSGGMMRQIVGGRNVEMTSTLRTTPDDRFLVINMYQHVAVWDLVKDDQLYHVYHPSPLNKVSLGADGRLLITAGFDYLIRVWDLGRAICAQPTQQTIDHFVAPSWLAAKPNPRYTVMQSFWDYVTVWDNRTGEKVKEIYEGIEQTTMMDDTTAMISSERQLKILDLPSGIVMRAIHGRCSYDNGKDKRVLEPALLDEERVLVASGGRRHLKIMSLTTGELLDVLKADATVGRIENLLVSKNGTTAVTLTDGESAVIWDIATKTHKLVPRLRRKGGFIHGQFTDISDDGRHLVNIDDSLGRREMARVYDLREARVKYTLPVKEHEIKCVAIATPTRRVLTGGEKFCVSVWDLDSGRGLHHLGGYEYPIHSLKVSGDGLRVLTSSLVTGEQSMRLYDILKGKLVAAFTPDESWNCTFHVDNKTVLCKPGFTGLVKFRLLTSSGQEEVTSDDGDEVDWGDVEVLMDDATCFQNDGDDNTDE